MLTQRETSDSESEGRLDVTAWASPSPWPCPGRRKLWKSWSQNDTDARAGVSAIGPESARDQIAPAYQLSAEIRH